MVNLVGGLVGHDATGAKVGTGTAALMVGGAMLDVAGGPAVDATAGHLALEHAMSGEFRAIAGAGTSKEFRAAASLSGDAADWAYVTSTEVWEHQGYTYQAHWAVNTRTGETAMAKLKLLTTVPGLTP